MGRKKEKRTTMKFRVDPATPDKIGQIAIAMGFVYGHREDGTPIPGNGEWLDAIGSGQVKLISDKPLQDK